jgi:hypothetical protein
MKCGPRQVNNSEWSYPTTALRRDSQLDAGATDSHRVLTADAEFAPHELGTDAIRCSVTSQSMAQRAISDTTVRPNNGHMVNQVPIKLDRAKARAHGVMVGCGAPASTRWPVRRDMGS